MPTSFIMRILLLFVTAFMNSILQAQAESTTLTMSLKVSGCEMAFHMVITPLVSLIVDSWTRLFADKSIAVVVHNPDTCSSCNKQ